MDKANFNYSLKNIPLCTKNTYLNHLIPKVTSFIQRLRWRACIFLSKKPNNLSDSSDSENENDNQNKDHFGFNSPRSAPSVPALMAFESDLYALISNLEFSKNVSPFQKKLLDDVKSINSSNQAFVLADKTNNVYQVEPELYHKLVSNSVTSTYKKDSNDSENVINIEAKLLCEKLDIADRVEKLPKKQAFITIKDHKPNFQENTKTRLINPMKSEVGKISKQLIQDINRLLRNKLKLQQWNNTDEVITWFNNLKNKSRLSFLNLDIVEFYPSISEQLFDEALDFASNHVPISEKDRAIFKNARKSLLHSDGSNWVKKTGLFDTTMGAFDGAECCELIGLYVLSIINDKYPDLNLGLYRDDGLAAHRRIPGPELERRKKDITKIFKNKGLSITISTGLKVVNFLDVTLDLNTEKHSPYSKPNNTPSYINVESNHPPNIIKKIPSIISKRLSKLSASENDFNTCTPEYAKALKDSGYKEPLTYTNTQKNKNKQRCRKITWFNPPYASNLKTDLGRQFLNLVDKHFKKDKQLSKIFNRHTLKLSYSCLPNMRSIILTHNNKLQHRPPATTSDPGSAHPPPTQNAPLASTDAPTAPTVPPRPLRTQRTETHPACNCRKPPCPLNEKCLTKSIVYKAEINTERHKAIYYGSTSTTFKERYRNHTASFRHESKRKNTALSEFVWENNLGTDPPISWSIVGERHPVKPGQICGICILEKITILKNKHPNMLNIRSEIGRKCPHRFKNTLIRC